MKIHISGQKPIEVHIIPSSIRIFEGGMEFDATEVIEGELVRPALPAPAKKGLCGAILYAILSAITRR